MPSVSFTIFEKVAWLVNQCFLFVGHTGEGAEILGFVNTVRLRDEMDLLK
jgi:hypothetical protein